MSHSTSAFSFALPRQVRPVAAALVLVLSLVLAGCLGGSDDDGGTLDDGSTDDGTNDGTGDDGNATDDDTIDESQQFDPENHTWDGVIPIHTCIDGTGGTCAYSPAVERDDSNTFEVPEGAGLASFEFTWERAEHLIIHVGGKPTVEKTKHPGTSPLGFAVPLDDPGTLAVSVSVYDEGGYLHGYDVPFHMNLTVS